MTVTDVNVLFYFFSAALKMPLFYLMCEHENRPEFVWQVTFST